MELYLHCPSLRAQGFYCQCNFMLNFQQNDVALHIIPQLTAHYTLLVLGTWKFYKFYFRVDLIRDLHLICSDG
jgi:hypothetical protein